MRFVLIFPAVAVVACCGSGVLGGPPTLPQRPPAGGNPPTTAVGVTPPPIIVIGTGAGGKIAVMVDNVAITDGESSNRVSDMLTWLIGSFVIYETSTDTTPKNATQLSVYVGVSEKARISAVGQQFHWQVNASGTLAIPEVCEMVNQYPAVPDCSANSGGIPAALVALSANVKLKAIYTGQSTLKEIHHAEFQPQAP